MKYEIIRPLFGGKMSQSQVDGIEKIIEEWALRGFKDIRWLAYILATVYWETGKTMQCVEEASYMGKKKQLAHLIKAAYYPYYGRDLVQTTWKGNYEKVKKFTGIDVVTHPEKIADPAIAAKVAIEFMYRGWYTGKKLAHFFNDKEDDPINARRIINGKDQAEKIAGFYQVFYKALIS